MQSWARNFTEIFHSTFTVFLGKAELQIFWCYIMCVIPETHFLSAECADHIDSSLSLMLIY